MTKLFSIIKKLVAPAVSVFISVLLIVGLVSAQTATFTLDPSQGVNRTEAVPGDTLEYGLTIQNTNASDLHNVTVVENFSPYVDYLPGSSTAERNGSVINLSDGWVTSSVNLGTLPPNQSVHMKFGAKIKTNTAVGSIVETTSQVKSDETPNWVQRAIQTRVVSPEQRAVLRAGNFLKVTNNTLQNGWQDSVNANLYHVVEFKAVVTNDGNSDARNLTFSANLPSQPSTLLHPSVAFWADNATRIEDNVTVIPASSAFLHYRVGHGTIFGNTALYNCPNGCPINESFYHTPLVIGLLRPGESATIQITFKADVLPVLTQTPTPTPTRAATPTPTPTRAPTPTPTPTTRVTPTPTPTGTPGPTATPTPTSTPGPTATPTPTVSVTPTVTVTPTITPTPTPEKGAPNECGGTCGSNENCQSGLFCHQGFCRNPNIVVNGQYVCSVTTTPTPTPVPSILGAVAPVSPKTGGPLVQLTLGLLTTGTVGFGLHRLARRFW